MSKKISRIAAMMLFSLMTLSAFFAAGGTAYAAPNRWREPAEIKYVDETLLSSLIDPRADGKTKMTESINGASKTYTPQRETYSPADRQWQGLPSVAKTGKRLWATWYTGGSGEPRQFNYLVVAYSDDGGENWIAPYIVIDHPDPEQAGVNLGVPNFWMDGDVLCLTWIQYGTWICRFHHPDAEDIKDVEIDEPALFMANPKIHKAPTFITDEDGRTALMCAVEAEVGSNDVSVTKFYVAKAAKEENSIVEGILDGSVKWQVRSTLQSADAADRRWPESQVAQAADGTLFVMSRLEGGKGGGIELAKSTDYGKTWSPYELNLSEPFIGPGSKFHIMRTAAGNMLIVNHSTTSSRASFYAYLSTDNGATWQYKMPIDTRTDVSYPCVNEMDGKFYVTWDKGRYNEKEIRLTVIDEEDVKAGEVVSEGSKEKIIVSKLNDEYTEIVSVNNAFEAVQHFAVGTASKDIRAGLPTTLTVTDNLGNDYELTGSWKSSGYKTDVAGTYLFTFSTVLPSTLSDTYDMLQVKVVTSEKGGKDDGGSGKTGCLGVVTASGGVALAGIFTAAALLLRKRGKK